MKLSIIIVNYKVEKEIEECVNSILKSNPGISYEIIIVDNSKSEKLKRYLSLLKVKNTYIRNIKNVGFGSGNNIGAKKAKGEILFLLNPDTIMAEGSFTDILSLFKNKKIGVVAPLLLDNYRKPYELQGTKILTPIKAIFSMSIISRIFPNNFIAGKYWMKGWNKNKEKQVEVAPGTAFFIRSELYKKIGGFDENFFLFFEEFDLCLRIKKLKYKIFISPKLKIIHFWGVSVSRNENSNNYFKNSRYYYFKKNYNLLSAIIVNGFLRISFSGLILCVVVFLGLFLRLYKLNDVMLFIGDQGWFYLSALNILKYGQIPLVGIASSVVWLHQGPLATYFIALALFVGRLNPIAPAVFFSIVDSVSIILIYFLAKEIFSNRTIGILASFFYATSPLVLITARMPYHTSSIPFFTAIFFLLLLKIIDGNKKLLFALFFCFGLLLQLELSNSVLFFVILLLFYFGKIKLSVKEICISLVSFLIGILPFILYDFSHNFIQTLGLPLWIINRTRLFLGLTLQNNSTTTHFPSAIETINMQFQALFSVYYSYVFFIFIVLFFIFILIMLSEKKYLRLLFVCSSLLVPIIAFTIHAAPGVAYFPLMFPIVSICVGATIYYVNNKIKILIPIFVIITSLNVYAMINNNYFITTNTSQRILPVNSYSYGYSIDLLDSTAKFITNHSNGNVQIVGRDSYSLFASNFDNLKFLLLAKEITISKSGKVFYIYPNRRDIVNKKNIVFSNRIFIVTQK